MSVFATNASYLGGWIHVNADDVQIGQASQTRGIVDRQRKICGAFYEWLGAASLCVEY
jgi:hypothetical protein